MDQSSFCWVPGAAAAAAPKGWTGTELTGTDSLAQSLTSGAGASPAHGCSRLMVPRRRRTSRASIHHMVPIAIWPLLLQGMAMSTCLRGESVLQKAMTGMLTYDASVTGWWSIRGSVTTSRRGSRKAAWIWLVKVPGVKRPAMGVAPVAEANFSTARWP